MTETSYYQWRNQNIVPTRPASVAYDRFWWSDLEPTPGVYDFTKLRLAYLTAASKGQRFAFRVRAMGEVGDWHCPYPDNGWNDSRFLLSAFRLLRMLGAEYDGKLAWLEIGILGSWGEWADVDAASEGSMQMVIEFHKSAFPQTQLLMKATTFAFIIKYAMRDPHMGWYINDLGDPASPAKFAEVPEMRGRPNAVEFKNKDKNPDYHSALRQVRDWNIHYVGNGNLPAWDSLTAEQQCALLEIATL